MLKNNQVWGECLFTCTPPPAIPDIATISSSSYRPKGLSMYAETMPGIWHGRKLPEERVCGSEKVKPDQAKSSAFLQKKELPFVLSVMRQAASAARWYSWNGQGGTCEARGEATYLCRVCVCNPPVELITAEGQRVKPCIWLVKDLRRAVVIYNIRSFAGKDNIMLVAS